jgi:hypothetical protein
LSVASAGVEVQVWLLIQLPTNCATRWSNRIGDRSPIVYGTVRTSSWESGYSLYACP